MKTKIVGILIISLVLAVASSSAQEFTLTTSPAHIISSKASIDRPGLADNPQAIIVATPVEGTKTLNPHPIGAWYYNGKWNIFNTDHAVMPVNAKYKIEHFTTPDENHFLHVITAQNIGDEGSYIDNPALNDHPNAKVNILQNYAPDNRPGYSLNPNEAKAAYNSASGKWYIANVNGKFLSPNTAYNIVVSSSGAIGSNTSTPSSTTATIVTPPVLTTATQPASVALTTPAPLPLSKPQTPKPIELTFDNLNDFVEKGLPQSSALPSGSVDQVAAIVAKQIVKADDQSLPVLLPALQAAGFTIIDKKGKVLLKPADGKGQGLGFYDFEAVGSLKLAQKGVLISLEGLAATMTKQTPAISGTRFADALLKELRLHANDSDNSYLRFYARLIIELGRSSAQPVDMMTAPASEIKLSVLQASLLIRRLQGTFYVLAKRSNPTGLISPPFLRQNPFIFASWKQDDLPFFRPVSRSVIKDVPCNLTGDQALILDGAAIHLTTLNGTIMAEFNSPRLGAGIQGANAALAWLKLVASVTMMKGQIIVQKETLIRTLNSDTSKPSNKRLLTARLWSEVGDVEVLNCLRPTLNLLTGLDFNLPTDGPLGDVAIEWHFAGDNETRVNNAATRNTEKFVVFESDQGKDRNPLKQVTDDKGISRMYLVGAPKIPAVLYQKDPMKIEKKAEVYVAVTLKSAKDVKQNVLDFSAFVLGVAQAVKGADTIGFIGVLIGAGAEIGYRTPYVAARATIPVIDHEPCDGQWVGTVTYTVIRTYKHTITYPAKIPPNSGGTGYFGGSTTTDQTVTLSGTATVNSKDGHNSPTTSKADEIMTMATSHSGAGYCGKKLGLRSENTRGMDVKSASGSVQGTTTVYITFFKDSYQISLKPIDVNATLKSSSESSHTGCNPGANSYNNSSIALYSGVLINGKTDIGDDPGILKGSTTTTTNVNEDGKTVTTITWNLRRCN